MEEPSAEIRQDSEKEDIRPDFGALTSPEEAVRGDRTRDDFFDAVLGLDEPATASEVAELAGRGVDAAREYLEWFERLGIVTQVTETPATYRRNQEYLNWRRVQRLQKEYSSDELVTFLKTETEREEIYSERFDAESPEAVSITATASATSQSVQDVWEDVSAWKTTRRRITLLERALTTGRGDAANERTAV
ncbi:winged helix-turn-helix domain-containing protein [Halorubrum luteum]